MYSELLADEDSDATADGAVFAGAGAGEAEVAAGFAAAGALLLLPAELGLVEPAVVDSAAVDEPRALRSLAQSLLACRPRSELSAGGLGV